MKESRYVAATMLLFVVTTCRKSPNWILSMRRGLLWALHLVPSLTALAMIATVSEPLLAAEEAVVSSAALQESLRTVGRLHGIDEYEQAFKLAKRVLVLAEEKLAVAEAHDPNSLETARALDLVVGARRVGGFLRDPRTLELAERALAIKERLLPVDDPDLVPTLRSLAQIRTVEGSTGAVAGIVLYRRALSILMASGDSSSVFAGLLGDVGLAHLQADEYSQARANLEKARDHQERLLSATTVHADSDAARNLGLGLSLTLHNLGFALDKMADYPAGIRALERSVALRKRWLGAQHKNLALPYLLLGALHTYLGDYQAATQNYQESLSINEREFGPKSGETAVLLMDLGWSLIRAGELDAARPVLERQFEIITQDSSMSGYWVSVAHVRLAELELALGNDTRARALLERAVAIGDTSLGKGYYTPFIHAYNTSLLVPLLVRAGEVDRSVMLSRQVIEVYESVLGPEHPELATYVSNLALLEYAQGEMARAFALASRAEGVGREHLRLTVASLPERQALSYASARISGLDILLSVASRSNDAHLISTAWDARIRSRALVLDEMAQRHRVTVTADEPQIAGLAARLFDVRRRMASLALRVAQEEDRAIIEQMRLEKEEAERALVEASSAFREQQRRDSAGLAEVVASLPPGSALVAYSRFEDRRGMELASAADEFYLAFVLRSGDPIPELVALGRAGEIDTLVSRWGATVSDPPTAKTGMERACRDAGESLRQQVWDPLVTHLEGSTRVFVVPDGALHLVNLAALPVGETQYLVESGPILHFLSAERDLLHPSMEAVEEGLLALGGPDFDARATGALAMAVPAAHAGPVYRGARTGCLDFRTQRFEALPGAKQEALEIGALWPGPVTHLSGIDASEAAFKALAPQHRVLHVATHGFFLDGRCRSALDAARGLGGVVTGPNIVPTAGAPIHPRSTGDNPLLLSGLVFQGANRRDEAGVNDEDGILTAEEIASLDLRGVEWAVLSACETGVGEVRSGEGVLGLRRAFEVAGVRSLIMSLWGVDDEATRHWMRKLYEARFLRGASTDEAVRAASLETLADRRARDQSTHPFYWGAFVAAGDWR